MSNVNRKKILYLITQSEWGGAQKYIFDLATWIKKDFQVEVGFGENPYGELASKLKEANIKYYFLKHVKRNINLWHDFLSIFELYKLFKKVKPDIIHLNSSKIGATAAVAGKIAGVPKIIYTVHGLVLNESLSLFHKIFYWFSEWLSNKLVDRVICVSEFDEKSLLRYKIAPKKKLFTIHNGIDLDNLKFLEREEARQKLLKDYKLKQGPSFWIGTIAHLYPNKGLTYLVEEAKEVVEEKPEAIFIVIGEGMMRKKLEIEITNYKLQDNFFLLGEIKNASLFLKAFDLFVLPSVKEGFPYTILEALAAKLPVVATKVGGIPEIIEDGVNGLLIEPKKPQALSLMIRKLIENQNLRCKLSKNSTESIRQFTLEKMIKETEKIYLE